MIIIALAYFSRSVCIQELDSYAFDDVGVGDGRWHPIRQENGEFQPSYSKIPHFESTILEAYNSKHLFRRVYICPESHLIII
jgi:hypothetical protein